MQDFQGNIANQSSVETLMNISLPLGNLPLNSSLALIPVALAYTMLWVYRLRIRRLIRNAVLVVLAVAWLAFLPNTCYLLTEWRHFLLTVDQQNLFLQSTISKAAFSQLLALSMFYLAYSAFGILAFALSIRPVERIARSAGATTWFWGLPFFMALSLGVYLGLILRFNSWDLIQQPGDVWAQIAALGGRPLLAVFIVAFGVFLWGIYESVDIWVDGLAERWSLVTGRRIHLGPREGEAPVEPHSSHPR
jgi:uncharacterized membrane protein